MGHRACLSHDGGASWDTGNEIVVRDDSPRTSSFRGRRPGTWATPATVELAPGALLTVYYQIAPPDRKPSIQATRWSLT